LHCPSDDLLFRLRISPAHYFSVNSANEMREARTQRFRGRMLQMVALKE
jgi:hypothetical protein